MQLIRLLAVVRRSGRNALSRPSRIDLDTTIRSRGVGAGGRSQPAGSTTGGGQQNDFSLDIDLEDDAEASRNRMRQGGDWSAGKNKTRRGAPPEREGLMHQDDDDDDEEL